MRRVHSVVLALTMLVSVVVVGTATSAGAAPVLPPQFTDTLVAGVGQPTALAFMPDGRMLVTTQPGRSARRVPAARCYRPRRSTSRRGSAATPSAGCSASPPIPTPASKAIYLYYTARGTSSSCPTGLGQPAGAPTNRVSRFVLRDDNTVDPGQRDDPARRHLRQRRQPQRRGSGGRQGRPPLRQHRRRRLRLQGRQRLRRQQRRRPRPEHPQRQDPAHHPHRRRSRRQPLPWAPARLPAGSRPASVGTTCQEIFATGLRNPFRFAFDPNASGTSFRINDVGQNVVGGDRPGRQGRRLRLERARGTLRQHRPGVQLRRRQARPVHRPGPRLRAQHRLRVHHRRCLRAERHLAVAYTGGYLFSDYVCGKIFLLSSGGVPHRLRHRPRRQQRRPPGVRTVQRQPGAVLHAATPAVARSAGSPTPGRSTGHRRPYCRPTRRRARRPLTTTLNGSGSSDPDGDALTYLWSFGDGTPTRPTSTPTIQHTYAAGSWTASLRVRDRVGAISAPATVAISSGNTAPTVTITSPSPTELFTVGASYTLARHCDRPAGRHAARLRPQLDDHPPARHAHPSVPRSAWPATTSLHRTRTLRTSRPRRTATCRSSSPRPTRCGSVHHGRPGLQAASKVDVTVATSPAGRRPSTSTGSP